MITVADAPCSTHRPCRALLDVHSGAAVTLTGFIADDPTGYGRRPDADDAVTAIVEHKERRRDNAPLAR